MKISICVIAYNEENSIQGLLNCISRQDYPHNKIEVLLIDSGSFDKTKSIMESFDKGDFLSVQVLDNPKKVLPCGFNIALDNYTGDAIVRLDAHAIIPDNFISENVSALMRGHNVVGGSRFNMANSDTPMQNTLLMAEESRFGSGIAPFRGQQRDGYVDALFHPCYKRVVFDRVGRFNEKLVRTEDNEMNYRIRKAGFRFYCSSGISSTEFIRSSFMGMMKQKFSNGLWIGRTLKECPKCLSVYHIVPAVFVLGLFAVFIFSMLALNGNVFAVFPAKAGLMALLLYGAFAVIMTITAVISGGKKRNITNILLPVIFLVMHICYGVGTIIGLVKS